MATGSLGGASNERYNVVEIYVLSWDLNTTNPSRAIDVQFRISVDSNGDGEYDHFRNSDVFRSSTLETAPFRLGDAILTSTDAFRFKVEVFQVMNGTLVPMHYLKSGTTPVNSGLNQEYFSKVWKYDATSGLETGALDCRISYVCYVESTS